MRARAASHEQPLGDRLTLHLDAQLDPLGTCRGDECEVLLPAQRDARLFGDHSHVCTEGGRRLDERIADRPSPALAPAYCTANRSASSAGSLRARYWSAITLAKPWVSPFSALRKATTSPCLSSPDAATTSSHSRIVFPVLSNKFVNGSSLLRFSRRPGAAPRGSMRWQWGLNPGAVL